MKRKYLPFLLNNLQYKALSVAVALGLWYLVQGDEILEISRRLDVVVEVPQGYGVREGDSISRDVLLKGPRVALSDFSNKPLLATVKLNASKKGLQRFRIDKEMIARLDPRIKLSIHDPYVTVFIDEKSSKTIPIKVMYAGQPKEGFSILESKADPSEVTITGLKSDIQKITEITTDVIDVNGLYESKSMSVPLSISSMPDFSLTSQQVVVQFTMSQGHLTKTFDHIPIEVIGTNRAASVHPSSVAVVIQGPSEFVAKITSKEISATVNADDAAPGKYTKRVQVRSLPGISVSHVTPSDVKLEVYNQKKI